MASRVPQITKQNVQSRKIYKDITINLDRTPITGELSILVNAEAVKQSIKNLVRTYPGERYYNPVLGSTISRSLFEFSDDFTLDQIKATTLSTITQWEPRALNPNVQVTAVPQLHAVNVDISFTITLFPDQRFSVPTIVLPVR
jgi:phage baseplate assembly protein W